MANHNHTWSFSTIGGVKRVNLESGGDLLNLGALDPKLWTALSCPVTGLEIDNKTLQWLDTDKDGHIRVPEVIAAVEWLTSALSESGDILKQEPTLRLSAINDKSDTGRILKESAETILKYLGKSGSDSISVDDTSDTQKIFAGTAFNGDGIVTEDSTADDATKALINDILTCIPGIADRGGKVGVNNDIISAFLDQCKGYTAWVNKKIANANDIMPFGEQTPAAYEAYLALKPKVDDFFMRCRLSAFDAQTTEKLNLQAARIDAVTEKNLANCVAEIAEYPLAKVGAGFSLPLRNSLNPAWEDKVFAINTLVFSSLFKNTESLTEEQWKTVGTLLAPYATWLSEKAGANVEALGVNRTTAILAGNGAATLTELIEKDLKEADKADNILLVDKLVRLHRDLYLLLKNFVTFFDFYNRESKAIFQAGTLYIDQRSCDLCIRVNDMAKQGSMANFSGMFLIYCDCVSKSGSEKMTIVAALTNGDVDNLVVGRNALFYDRLGMDWDATITKIIDNPISIRQAFFSPYRKAHRFIETQINKAASAQESKVAGNINKGIEETPAKLETKDAKKDPAPPFDVGKFVGIFAAIGLAVGAIGTAVTTVAGGFMALEWWKMPIAIAGILLVISGPSMIIAYLKLRQRNLAPILDANGWAINAMVKVNIQFGNTLTHLAELPKGARISLNDPFTQKKRPILPALIIIAIVAAAVYYVLVRYGYAKMIWRR